MPSYSLAVAIFDFIPVAVSAFGLAILADAIGRRHRRLSVVAWAAAIAIPMGGFCKATWKLLVAAQIGDYTWLENLLFILMAPGFVAIAFALFHTRRAWQAGMTPELATAPIGRLLFWLAIPVGGALAALAFCPLERSWFFWLLGVTTLANFAFVGHAIYASRVGKLGAGVIVCFVYNLAATLTLSSLARLPDTEATAWIQEGVNLSAQGALAAGLWFLAQRMKKDITP